MISVEEATEIILSKKYKADVETVPLEDSVGRVLAEPLIADRDFPPYDRVTMDGIAIRGDDFLSGSREFTIQELCAAGDPKATLTKGKKCIEIMTGAILPSDADSIIRYEDLTIKDGVATISEISFRKGQNVHEQGSDQKKDDSLVAKGRTISAAEIGIAASIGKSSIHVFSRPRIAVISSGDELVDIDSIPLEHQVRKSNVWQMEQALRQNGFPCKAFHIIDNFNMIESELAKIMETHDVLILSGGVSKGKKDFIPDALESLGVAKKFHRISQRPGKPMWFGTRDDEKFVFALPGNPVSSFMCLYRYVIPWLNYSLSKQPSPRYAILESDIPFRPDLTYFVPVKLRFEEAGKTFAIPSLGNGSGDLVNLNLTDGFVELEKGRDLYTKGSVYKYISYR